eukprot:IDg3845t1
MCAEGVLLDSEDALIRCNRYSKRCRIDSTVSTDLGKNSCTECAVGECHVGQRCGKLRKKAAAERKRKLQITNEPDASSPPLQEKRRFENPGAESSNSKKPSSEKPSSEKPSSEKPSSEKHTSEKHRSKKPSFEKSRTEKSGVDKLSSEKSTENKK